MDIRELISFYHTARMSSVSQAQSREHFRIGANTAKPTELYPRIFRKGDERKGLHLQVSLEMDHSELVRRYVEIGMGVAVTTTQMFAPNQEESSKLAVLDLSCQTLIDCSYIWGDKIIGRPPAAEKPHVVEV